jgi:formylglycine-generating enzyme required for sulfatase activity
MDETKVDIYKIFNTTEGKFVIQLFDEEILIDERILKIPFAQPVRVSYPSKTKGAIEAPKGMKLIPGGNYNFYSYNDDNFIPYPANYDTVAIEISPFYMDVFPVTNFDFAEFLEETDYVPDDTSAFLAHWSGGTYPESMADHPVVYIDYNDAKAFAEWAGKRLPTEVEWQYAAQGKSDRNWPWGQVFDSLNCNNSYGATTPVHMFLYGESPFGIIDMVGNVWQMTSDIYYNGSYYFQILKGGSFYKPSSSWWYIDGGPQPVNWTQMLLLTGPGMSRNSTVGFRCVKDAEQK